LDLATLVLVLVGVILWSLLMLIFIYGLDKVGVSEGNLYGLLQSWVFVMMA
jgi:hypothetical protein